VAILAKDARFDPLTGAPRLGGGLVATVNVGRLKVELLTEVIVPDIPEPADLLFVTLIGAALTMRARPG